MRQKVIFATKNPGKLTEVTHIIGDKEFELLSLNDFNNVGEIIEDGNTFEENAVKKARYFFSEFGIPTVADDSGLVVEQLKGSPGVHSARYAGKDATDEENNKKLISQLLTLPQPHTAKFVCSAIFFDGKSILKTEGEMVGQVIHKLRGKNGFGYDPLFVPDGYSQTSAELSLEEKNKISHRAKAFNSLFNLIKERG